MNTCDIFTREWVAGFMCGEGFFYCQHIGKYEAYSLGVCMHNRDECILKGLKAMYGGTIQYRKRDTVQWRILSTKEIVRFSEDIGPLLYGYKKEQFNKWWSEFMAYKKKMKKALE